MLPLLLPEPSLRLDRVEITDRLVTLCLRTAVPTVACPLCQQAAHKVHSRYLRRARDLPIHGRATVLLLTARRFFCTNPDCRQRVFCERQPHFLAKHARATTRLTDTQTDLGLALGGEPGARLAGKLGMPTSPDTLLRRVKRPLTDPSPEPPRRVVGVDDWALRKGQTYGTIIIDLERSEVLELLPGRDGVELKKWLQKHPEVEVLARDRWVPFADAMTEGAPQARQVADRFHLFKNIREALERFLDHYRSEIRQAFPQPVATPIDPAVPEAAVTPDVAATNEPPVTAPLLPLPDTQGTTTSQRPLTAKQQQRRERFEEVLRRHAQGQSQRRIAREVGLSKGAVVRYLRTGQCPDWRPGRVAASRADGYRERVDRWLAEGERNVAELHRQLATEGTTVGYDALRRFVTRRLTLCGPQAQQGKAKRRRRHDAARARPRPPPSARSLSFAVIIGPEQRTEKQQDRVQRLRQISSEVSAAVELVEGFARLLRKQSQVTLTEWHEQALTSTSKELQRFARGLEQDWAAVQAAVDEPWSSGPVEAQVGRLKAIKRSMYGRAGLPLLRARVLRAN